MKKKQEKDILIDCKVMLRKLGDIPFNKALLNLQNELWEIGDKYGITGAEVLDILFRDFPKKAVNNEEE